MNAIGHARSQARFTNHIGDIIDLTVAHSYSTDPAERQRLAEQIADHHDKAANILATSVFVRKANAGMTCGTPEAMRAKAEHWRLHGDPEEGNQ